MLIAVLGLFAVALDPDISTVSIPILRMVQNGVGSVVLTPLISLLIVLGAVSTGVNMTAAMVKRVTGRFEKPEISRIAAEKGKTTKMAVIVALCCCVVDWAVAQFGLLTLIGKGYSFIAYLAIPVILVPYIIHMTLSSALKMPRKRLVLIFGGIGIVLACIGFYNMFGAYINFLASTVPPVVGVFLADYLFKYKKNYPALEEADLPNVEWSGFISWGIGFAVSYVNFALPTINCVVVAFIVKTIFVLAQNKRQAA